MAALEGQGQDELFDALSGRRKRDGGGMWVNGQPLTPRTPYDAIRAGVVLVPADRVEALLPQQSVRDNIAVPLYNRAMHWGPINLRSEWRRVGDAIRRLQIDTRAQRQVRRLSGGNQQKVTVARWLATGFQVLLLFDPTRGIDVGTKRQIHTLLRQLAADGAGVLLFTSELSEIQLVCDRVLVLYEGKFTAGNGRLRCRRRGTAAGSPWIDAHRGGGMSSVAATTSATPFITAATRRRFLRRNTWGLSIYGILIALLIVEKIVHPTLNAFDVQTLVIETMPLALAAMAQSSVVLVGGIDLSIGNMMALVNVVGASWMVNADFKQSALEALVIIAGTAVLGAITGFVITISRVPDIIVTLATSFIWYGLALRVMGTPGGGTPIDFQNLTQGQFWNWFPEGLLVLIGIVLLVWLPWYRSKLGLSVYALGSNRTAAFLSGVSVGRTRILAYALGGLFAGLAGLALLAGTGLGDPNSASNFTLNSVACVVLGGVSLAGGRGGMMGPLAAAFVLNTIGVILGFMQVDPNYATVIQGAIVVLVVLVAGLLALRRRL